MLFQIALNWIEAIKPSINFLPKLLLAFFCSALLDNSEYELQEGEQTCVIRLAVLLHGSIAA